MHQSAIEFLIYKNLILAFAFAYCYNIAMENEKKCFTAVEFVDDPNVVGYCYWYLCEIDGVEVGDKVIAPLGRHNNLQEGVVRKVIFEEEENAPYPMHSIKYIKKVVKENV